MILHEIVHIFSKVWETTHSFQQNFSLKLWGGGCVVRGCIPSRDASVCYEQCCWSRLIWKPWICYLLYLHMKLLTASNESFLPLTARIPLHLFPLSLPFVSLQSATPNTLYFQKKIPSEAAAFHIWAKKTTLTTVYLIYFTLGRCVAQHFKGSSFEFRFALDAFPQESFRPQQAEA